MTGNGYPFVLAFGDSLPAAIVRNAGVSGDTTGSALARLPTLPSSLSERPDLALVELGANDLIRRVAPARTRANLDSILHSFGRCAIPVLIAAFEPPAFLGDHARSFAGIYDDLAREHRAALHPFFPPGVAGHHAHVLRDRIHPNATAIAKVARAMAPAVIAALQRRPDLVANA